MGPLKRTHTFYNREGTLCPSFTARCTPSSQWGLASGEKLVEHTAFSWAPRPWVPSRLPVPILPASPRDPPTTFCPYLRAHADEVSASQEDGTALAHRELPRAPLPPGLSLSLCQPTRQVRSRWPVRSGRVQGPGPIRGHPGHSSSRQAVLRRAGQDGERPKPTFVGHRKAEKWR